MSSSSDLILGKRFSHVYLSGESLTRDSRRMRARLASCFSEYFSGNIDRSASLGSILEAEIGIKFVQSNYMAAYVNWSDSFQKIELRDLLDAITITVKKTPELIGRHRKEALVDRIKRIFDEELVGYWIDEHGGVHPKVDTAFEMVRRSVVEALEGNKYQAARSHLNAVDDAMLQNPMDGRTAIQRVFDVIENIFKQNFSGVTHLNSAAIANQLRPFIESRFSDSEQERRASLKAADGLRDWVDGAHFYRHEAGKPDPSQPTESFAILMVSNGYAFSRWMAQLFV